MVCVGWRLSQVHACHQPPEISEYSAGPEFRGVVERFEEDPGGAFYETLAKRYGAPWGYPGDPRVIFFMKIEHIAGQNL